MYPPYFLDYGKAEYTTPYLWLKHSLYYTIYWDKTVNFNFYITNIQIGAFILIML